MRIAFDVSYIQRRRAGIGRHALQLLKSLLASDFANEYVLHGWSFGLDVKVIENLCTSNTLLSIARIPGDVKRFYWNNLGVPVIESFVGKCDVFHSTDPHSPPVRNARKIVTVHDLAYRKFPHMFEPRVLAWHDFVLRSVQSADAIIVPSESTKTDLLEMFSTKEENIYVLKVPVDDIFVASKSAEDEKGSKRFDVPDRFMLFAGTVEPRKNIPSLVRAFERVQADVGVDLVLAGKKGWMYEESLKAISDSNVRSRIHYLEYVTDKELVSLYRQATCFVYPSLYEGYGFPILEAMASGAPVITSNNSSMRELSGGAALLVDPGSVDDIAHAMHACLTNEKKRNEMRQLGLNATRQYTAESAARRVLDIYRVLA